MGSQYDDSIVAYLIDHLFLPTRINSDWLKTACAVDMDSTNLIDQAELCLLSFVITTLSEFRESGIWKTPADIGRLNRAEKMLRLMRKLLTSPPGSPQLESLLMEQLIGMEEGGMYTLQVMFCHINP